MEISECLIESLVEIGNHPNLVKEVEPQVCFPKSLKPWMVRRVLKAICLYNEAYKRMEGKQDDH